jgi:cerevisin
MASPHICGLLAYLVSIEGTETFSILSGDSESQVDETEELAVFGTTSLYGKALSLLPKLAQSVLPAPATVQDEDAIRPTPPKKGELTPAKLKKALIALASPGKLIDQLPAGTPNLLAFNNATVAAKR